MDDVNIRVLIYRESALGYWIAQGLEHDIVASAPTLEELHKRFRMQVAAHFISADELGPEYGLDRVRPAPKDVWEKYERAGVETSSKPSPIRTNPPMELPRIAACFRIFEPALAAE